MTYEDVDEIKTKLHTAYMNACDAFGKGCSVGVVDAVAFESSGIKFSVRVERK